MTETAPRPRKGGRPSKPDGKSLSKTMNFRVPPELYRQVVAAAEADSISISEEVGRRLSHSFFYDDLYKARFGNERISFLANLFASVLNTFEASTGKSCIGNDEMRKATIEAVENILLSAADLFKDTRDVSAMQRKFDRDDFRRMVDAKIDDATFALVEPERLSLAEIMKR